MSEKIFNTRIQHKHDIEANWLKATNFVPKVSELIVYDPDENFNYSRVKIGDGVTKVKDLPFHAGTWEEIADKPFEVVDKRVEILEETLLSSTKVDVSVELENDTEYIVILNDTEYRLTSFVIGDDILLGETDYWYHISDGTYPFGISTYNQQVGCDSSEIGSTIKILQEVKYIKYIDERVIPDTIPYISSASSGQTIVVKSVDESGRPTEWEAVDMPEPVQPDLSQNDPEAADYVKGVIRQESLPEGYMSWNSMIHKPFVKFESKIIEWDGDKEGHDKVILSGDGSGFQASCYWVSDYIPFHGLELGDNVSATINVSGVGFSGEDKNGAFTEWSVTYNSENSRNIANFGYIALKDKVEEENYNGETISFPKKGLYLYENITGVLPPFTIEFAEAIRTIDESYIPDTIARASQIPQIVPMTETEIDEICNATIYVASEVLI